MNSPSTPQGRSRELQERPINTLAEQLQGCTISKPKKREQTTATPASQARPRTQRRTGEDQENTPAASDPADASTSSGVTPSRLRCYADLQDELSCGICLEICVRPCATPCGHAFCRTCLRQALQHKRQCPKCRDVLPTSWQPKVNVALWNTIQLLFPRHAAQAPPPTPPQLQAATGASATGRNRSRGGSQGVQVLSSSLPGGVFAAQSQAARQAFRPPRPAGASQEDAARAHTRTRQLQQQQHAERFVMPPDLQMMLQGMARANQHASRQAAVASQSRRSSRQQLGNLFSSAVHGASQGETSISIDIDIEDEVMSQLTGNSSEQQAAQPSRRASSQQAAHATQSRQRQRQRAAAAARVHAAIAEEEQDVQEEQDLHAAILASLHDSGSGSAMHPDAAAAGGTGRSRLAAAVGSVQPRPAAAAAHGSRSRTLRLQPLRQANHASSDTDEDFFPDFDVSEISDDDDGIITGHTFNNQPGAPRSPNRPETASLFGRIHSGSSPQRQWPAPNGEGDSDDDWIHEVGALVDELANRTTATAAAASSGSNIAAGVQSTIAARQPSSSQAAAALTARLQQRPGSSSNNTAAGAHGSNHAGQGTNTITADNHQDLLYDLSDFEDDLGPAFWQQNTAAGTAAAAASRVCSRAPAAAAGIVQCTSAAASAAAAAPTEASNGTAQGRRRSVAATSARSATAQAATTSAGGVTAGRRRGGRARVIEDDDAGEPGILATSATAVGSYGSSSDSVNRGAQQSQHGDNGGAAVAAAVQGVEEQVVNVHDLVLMPSPEPQPLMARLATFGGHASQQHTTRGAGITDQQQQHGVLLQMVDAALGAGEVGVNSINTSTVNRSAGGSTSDITVADDDFLPTRPNRRGLNAAAAVSAALRQQTGSGSPPRARGRARAGRVVPGLRRTRG